MYYQSGKHLITEFHQRKCEKKVGLFFVLSYVDAIVIKYCKTLTFSIEHVQITSKSFYSQPVSTCQTIGKAP